MQNFKNTFKVQVDTKGFNKKPESEDIGGIKARTQKSEPKSLTLEELAGYIEKGHSFSTGVLCGGLGAKNWSQQQLFAIDIDNNNEDLPILGINDAIKIYKDKGLEPVIGYYSFSCTKDKPKYRLIFAMDEVVVDESKRSFIIETLIKQFPQADESCKNADRIFYGTNKKVKIAKIINKVDFQKIIELGEPERENTKSELDDLKAKFDFQELLDKECGEIVRLTDKYIMYKNCPICSHKEDFVFYPKTNTFKCFGANGNVGGSIIDYLMYTRKFNQKKAIDHFLYSLCKLPKNTKQEHFQIPKQLTTISSHELMTTELPPMYWCVENLLPQGLAILCSPPKFGKSWLCLLLSIKIALGNDVLGFKTNKSRVLYLALEDSNRRIKHRLNKLLDNEKPPENIEFAIQANSISLGLIDMLEDFVATKPDTKLIIIDTLQKIRTGANKNEGAYAADYRELGLLKSFADKHNICMLVVHHLRKQKDSDVFNKISGTNGIMGTADTLLIIEKTNRSSDDAELHITGRDVEEESLFLQFDNTTCEWTSNGNAEIQERKREKQEYENDHIMKAVHKLLETEDTWKGTIKELLSDIYTHCKISIDDSPETVGKRLRKYQQLMYQVHGIDYIPPSPNGSNGKRIHKFKKGFTVDSETFEQLFD